MFSTRKVLQHDFYSRLYVLFLAVGFAALGGLILLAMNNERSATSARSTGLLPAGVGLGLAATVVCLFLFVFRLVKIQRICCRCPVVRGRVVDNAYALFRGRPRNFWQGGGVITYEFEWEGAQVRTWHAIWRTVETEDYDVGDSIRLAVDPKRPDLAIPIDLFLAAKA